MVNKFVQEVIDRIKNIQAMIEEELASPNPSLNFIDDCKLTLAQCQHQIGYFNENPSGVEVI